MILQFILSLFIFLIWLAENLKLHVSLALGSMETATFVNMDKYKKHNIDKK